MNLCIIVYVIRHKIPNGTVTVKQMTLFFVMKSLFSDEITWKTGFVNNPIVWRSSLRELNRANYDLFQDRGS